MELLELGTEPDPQTFRTRLIEALTKEPKAKRPKDLIEIYDNHFGQNHNVVSMSLYSGPDSVQAEKYPDSVRAEGNYDWHSTFKLKRKLKGDHSNKVAAGWMSTGDSMLREEKRRKPWLKFYAKLKKEAGILTLPHHGSNYNFHEQLLNENGLRLDIVTTVKKESRVAGISETLRAVAKKGQTGVIVDNRSDSFIAADVRRLLNL
jgi:hypothetical protein